LEWFLCAVCTICFSRFNQQQVRLEPGLSASIFLTLQDCFHPSSSFICTASNACVVSQGHEITPQSDWPQQYHMAMSQGCNAAKARPVEEVDCCLEVCHHAVAAAAERSTLEKAHRQTLENRYAACDFGCSSFPLLCYVGYTPFFALQLCKERMVYYLLTQNMVLKLEC
jgi:hypothetical protein